MTPADVGIDYQEITLTSADGVELRAWYVPPQKQAAIILVHTLHGNRTNTIPHLQALAENGYGIVAFDLRAHGESGGEASLWELPDAGHTRGILSHPEAYARAMNAFFDEHLLSD